MNVHASNAGSVALSISGMTCSGCANTVTRVLSRVPGVASAQVDLASGRAVVVGEARQQDLIAAVEAAGFEAQAAPGEPSRDPQ
jgi:copper chaperone